MAQTKFTDAAILNIRQVPLIAAGDLTLGPEQVSINVPWRGDTDGTPVVRLVGPSLVSLDVGDDEDDVAEVTSGRIPVVARLYAYDGTDFDRIRSQATNVDNFLVQGRGALWTVNTPYAYDSANTRFARIEAVTDIRADFASAGKNAILAVSPIFANDAANSQEAAIDCIADLSTFFAPLNKNALLVASANVGLDDNTGDFEPISSGPYNVTDNSDPSNNLLGVGAFNLLHDETVGEDDWARQRSNASITALASAARTATNNSGDIRNYNWRGAHIIIDVTAITATPSVTFTIQGKDETSGQYYPILVSAAITAVGTTVLRVYPDLTAVANLTVNDVLPKEFRILATHADADSITYSVGVNGVV